MIKGIVGNWEKAMMLGIDGKSGECRNGLRKRARLSEGTGMGGIDGSFKG